MKRRSTLERFQYIAKDPRHLFSTATFLALPLLLSALTACGDDDVIGPDEEVFEVREVTLDASSHVNFVYLDLASGTRASPADPASSTDWHMGFRRFSIRLNVRARWRATISGIIRRRPPRRSPP